MLNYEVNAIPTIKHWHTSLPKEMKNVSVYARLSRFQILIQLATRNLECEILVFIQVCVKFRTYLFKRSLGK